ncbi:exosome complex component CSL4 [Iris pallida]|uniref:Exosome complex component CSL4 n=1 Tax=Iris pallida TaxID=29817 RepID=A0AAX6HRJ4_IRIPA|nr:exosome complex component CSL4 [Iris pallida]
MAMEEDVVTPGEIVGDAADLIAGKGSYLSTNGRKIHASLTGVRRILPPPPSSADQRATVKVVGSKSHGAVPEPGSVVIARVTKVMARVASADIMCVGTKSVKEKFTGTIRQQC